MSKQPKVSVIVPIFKVEKYLVQCLESIVNQTLKDIEIILVDEGDMDACRYIIDHYEQTDPRVIAIHEKNGGYGASVNKGFDVAKGEYISIIESDDFIDLHMLEEMYNYAKKLGADVVKAPYYEYYSEKRDVPRVIVCPWAKSFSNVPEGIFISVLKYPQFMGTHPSIWSAIYKRSYFNKYNIVFDQEGAYVDQTFKLHVYLNTNKLVWLNKPFYYYRSDNPEASDKNFNLDVMLRRWSDVHRILNERYAGKYDYIAPYMIVEEYVCTILKLQRAKVFVSQKQLSILKDNFSYTGKEVIEASTILKPEWKACLLKFCDGSIKSGDLSKPEVLSEEKLHILKVKLFKELTLFSVVRCKNKIQYKIFDFLTLVEILKNEKQTVIKLFNYIPLLTIRRKEVYA